MPSAAANGFFSARDQARTLVLATSHPPQNSLPDRHKSACLHAAWAMLVAAWEAYLERLVREAQQAITDPSHAKLSAVIALLKLITENEIKRFNTPNSGNARDLLYQHTGYDPINDWHWVKAGLSGPQSRSRLDEILRVRHSFAHGFPIPVDITWVKNRSNPGRLNIKTVKQVDEFLSHLVRATDTGMSSHLSSVFGILISW